MFDARLRASIMSGFFAVFEGIVCQSIGRGKNAVWSRVAGLLFLRLLRRRSGHRLFIAAYGAFLFVGTELTRTLTIAWRKVSAAVRCAVRFYVAARRTILTVGAEIARALTITWRKVSAAMRRAVRFDIAARRTILSVGAELTCALTIAWRKASAAVRRSVRFYVIAYGAIIF